MTCMVTDPSATAAFYDQAHSNARAAIIFRNSGPQWHVDLSFLDVTEENSCPPYVASGSRHRFSMRDWNAFAQSVMTIDQAIKSGTFVYAQFDSQRPNFDCLCLAGEGVTSAGPSYLP